MNQCLNCPTCLKNGFCNMSEDAREFLLSNSVPVEYPRGTVMFREGESADSIYILCTGRFKVSATSHEGRTMILRIAESGSVLGLSAALSDIGHEVTAEALEPCRVRVMHKRILQQLLRDFPAAAVGAAHTIAAEYRAAFEEARRIALPDGPSGRIACLLMDWMDKGNKESARLIMPLTHDELASMTATTRETVTRTLSRFRKAGLIQSKGIVFNILQPDTLRELATC